MFRRIVVAVSGGVDSAVAAFLLKRKGFNVQAVFMKNWDEIDEHGQCSGEADFIDAKWTCDKLEIPLIQINFVKQYWNEVFNDFLQDYENGLTPNPDILCNRYIKFNYFYKYARKTLEADAIATGHYARSSFGCYLENWKSNENARLLCAADAFKDQTFFLSQIPQAALHRTMFPLGDYQKKIVKQIAMDAGLYRLVQKRESTGICFVGKRNFNEFISEYIDGKPGNFVNIDTGAVIGQHAGIHHWTVGQRCKISGSHIAYFTLEKLPKTNTILVSPGTDHPSLFTDLLYTERPNWIARLSETRIFRGQFRFQHTKPLVDCLAFESDRGLLVKLDRPLRALTPGQFAVFYQDMECLGSARIIKPGPSVSSVKLTKYIYECEDDSLEINKRLN